MLFSNIGIRERIQILYLLVMQQGTRANLCTLATCRLFISFPVSLALCSREIGCGRRGKERRGYGASGEIKTNYELFKFSCAGSLSQQMKMSTDIFILIMDTSHLSELTRSFSVEIGPQ